MIDIGGALPTILNEIVDKVLFLEENMPQPVQSDLAESDNESLAFIKNRVLKIPNFDEFHGLEKTVFANSLQITVQQLESLMDGAYTFVDVDSINIRTGYCLVVPGSNLTPSRRGIGLDAYMYDRTFENLGYIEEDQNGL